jgi:hypothetical protein
MRKDEEGGRRKGEGGRITNIIPHKKPFALVCYHRLGI